MESSSKLSNLQLELLKIFQYDLSDAQLLDIKQMLSKYFAEKSTQEMDKLWEEKGWSDKTMEDWSNQHLRSKSK